MAKKRSEEIGPVGGRKKASLSEMSGDKSTPIEDVKSKDGEDALLAHIVEVAVDAAQPKLTPAEAKLSAIDRQSFNAARTKKSGAIRAKYREQAAEFVQPMTSTIDDIPHIEGIDDAYYYLLEKAGRPPLNFMVYLAVTFILGVGVGAFTKII